MLKNQINMDLRVNSFGLSIKANMENCGLEEQVQVVYIDSMAILLKEYINYKHERTKLSFVSCPEWEADVKTISIYKLA